MYSLLGGGDGSLGDDDLRHGSGWVQGVGEGLEADAHVVDVVLEHLWFRKLWITTLQAGEAPVSFTLTSYVLEAGVGLCFHPGRRRAIRFGGQESLGFLVHLFLLEPCEWLRCSGFGGAGGGECCLLVLVS